MTQRAGEQLPRLVRVALLYLPARTPKQVPGDRGVADFGSVALAHLLAALIHPVRAQREIVLVLAPTHQRPGVVVEARAGRQAAKPVLIVVGGEVFDKRPSRVKSSRRITTEEAQMQQWR